MRYRPAAKWWQRSWLAWHGSFAHILQWPFMPSDPEQFGRAVPVEPDKLGTRLLAFSNVLPKLHVFRLCHRFGKGDSVYITKLPAEVELIIEGMLIRDEKHKLHWDVKYEWESDYRCFQSICSPAGHFEDLSPIWDAAHDDLDECAPCAESSIYDAECANRCTERTESRCGECKMQLSADCENTCLAQYDVSVNEMCWESDYGLETHWTRGDNWERRVNQKEGGAFGPLEKASSLIKETHVQSRARETDARVGSAAALRPRGLLRSHPRRQQQQGTLAEAPQPSLAPRPWTPDHSVLSDASQASGSSSSPSRDGHGS